MHFTLSSVVLFFVMASFSHGLTIKRFDSTTPKVTTPRTTTPKATTVSPTTSGKEPIANGPIVVLVHHGTLDGPSGRFRKTEFVASPPVDLSVPPVFLPEAIPIHEPAPEELSVAASYDMPRFQRTEYLAAPPIDLGRPPVFLPEATPIEEPSQEVNAARQALYFVRG